MKKTILLLAVVATVVLVTYSCKDEMKNEPFVNGSAVIQGTAFVNSDLTNDTLMMESVLERVPSGLVRIYALISSQDLVQNPSAGVSYGDIIVDTIIGANGTFTLVVPANNKNVTVELFADDFVANQVQPDTTVESKIFYLPEDTYTEVVRNGVTRHTEITFGVK
jgi:hypothetical protein